MKKLAIIFMVVNALVTILYMCTKVIAMTALYDHVHGVAHELFVNRALNPDQLTVLMREHGLPLRFNGEIDKIGAVHDDWLAFADEYLLPQDGQMYDAVPVVVLAAVGFTFGLLVLWNASKRRI